MRSIINISLPPKMTQIVEDGVKRGNFSSKSEFFRALIRLWTEGKLAGELEDSRQELRTGKGKLLRSLRDLRQIFGMQIYYSSKFAREYKKLPKKIKEGAVGKEVIFRNNPFDSRLDTHKLSGRLKEYWAFSINNTYRIIFEFAKKNTIWFHSVGDHSIYQ